MENQATKGEWWTTRVEDQMRIRTIKPEFWSHRKLGRSSSDVKCMAIGLLNYADDEGYFEYDEVLIKAALFPFQNGSLNTHGVLSELSLQGYIEVRECADFRKIGKIINFTSHQVINRPSPSKLKTYYDSGSPHGVLSESSLLEQGKEQGTGNREMEGNGKPKNHRRSAPCVSDEFLQFWDKYPRRQAMKPAWRAWEKLHPPIESVLETLDKAKKHPSWCRGKQFIPLPASWLNDERWDDEL